MQGIYGKQTELERFREMHGMPAFNYMIQAIEGHARKLGFEEVEIRVPETLNFYHIPIISMKKESAIRAKYRSKAKAEKALEREREMVRRRMEALYKGIAKAMDYRRKGLFYVKRL